MHSLFILRLYIKDIVFTLTFLLRFLKCILVLFMLSNVGYLLAFNNFLLNIIFAIDFNRLKLYKIFEKCKCTFNKV